LHASGPGNYHCIIRSLVGYAIQRHTDPMTNRNFNCHGLLQARHALRGVMGIAFGNGVVASPVDSGKATAS